MTSSIGSAGRRARAPTAWRADRRRCYPLLREGRLRGRRSPSGAPMEPDGSIRKTRVLGLTDTRAHLIRLQETDPELEAKATAWVAYFERHGVKRSRETILESWAKLEAE